MSEKDASGNSYVDVRNVRITSVPSTWDAGSPGLRIQAYKGNGDSLFPGAEIAIPDKATAYDFIRAISCMIHKNGI